MNKKSEPDSDLILYQTDRNISDFHLGFGRHFLQ